jgi:hypothetical protein
MQRERAAGPTWWERSRRSRIPLLAERDAACRRKRSAAALPTRSGAPVERAGAADEGAGGAASGAAEEAEPEGEAAPKHASTQVRRGGRAWWGNVVLEESDAERLLAALNDAGVPGPGLVRGPEGKGAFLFQEDVSGVW